MTAAVAVGLCMGIAGLVVVLCAWQVRDAEKRREIAEDLLAGAEARARRLQGTVTEQATLIAEMRRHIEDTSDGWVTYQRSQGYRAVTAVQVIRMWMN